MKINHQITLRNILPLAVLMIFVLFSGLGCAQKTATDNTNAATNASDDSALLDNTNEAVSPEDSTTPNTNDAADTNAVRDTSGNTNATVDTTEETNAAPVQTSPIVTDKPAKYAEYTDKTLAEAKTYGRPVLFFYASWDQISKDAEVDILASLDTLPAGVTVLKVNYDSADVLKKQYGVTYQHSFVQIDAHGNKVTSWSGADAASISDNLHP